MPWKWKSTKKAAGATHGGGPSVTSPSPSPLTVCASCLNLQLSQVRSEIGQFRKTVESGCESCVFLNKVISHFTSIDKLKLIILLVESSLSIYLYKRDELGADVSVIELFTDKGNPTHWRAIGPARQPTADAGSPQSLALMKQWLWDCQDSHRACKQLSASKELPTRVIDVGTGSDDMRLHVSNGEEGAYAALSYCWGNQKALTTMKANLADHQKSLRFDDSYKTFIDAAHVTRSLGIRYLWIDSLCIVQDDTDDWIAQSATMNQVYHNAVVTLSADGAENASTGLFGAAAIRFAAHEAVVFMVKHPETTSSSSSSSVPVYARLRSRNPSTLGNLAHSTKATSTSSQLSTRAWAYQERILSRRNIHFHREEMVWSCMSQRRCECRWMPDAPLKSHHRRLITDSSAPKQDLILEWPSMIMEYSERNLTYHTDRLPALSGLAAIVQQRTLYEYHAGLWECDMNYSILWMTNHRLLRGTTINVRRLDNDYAPTWSWASVSGPVSYFKRHRDQFNNSRTGADEIDPVLRVIQVVSQPLTANLFGPVKAAFLCVQGQVLAVKYHADRGKWRPIGHQLEDELAALRVGNTSKRGGDNDKDESKKEPREPQFVYDVPSESPELGIDQSNKSAEFVLLRAAIYIWGGEMSSPSTEVMALLLARIPIEVHGLPVYRRVGVAFQAFHGVKVWGTVPVQTIILF